MQHTSVFFFFLPVVVAMGCFAACLAMMQGELCLITHTKQGQQREKKAFNAEKNPLNANYS